MTATTPRPDAQRAPGASGARLRGIRLQGFKSFAERTVLEFGPGISAVVGPNGSGKSNLADALRWTLGEQGKALRSRKSEDVIFAGSEKRSALGMADVTLVIDNSDALLPVEYEMLEIGRRLYRSGENDYLLNKQRLRLRDLVDLLDAAHLADNAFLFIGQGMVDQVLALRPEDRRPLFEEVAGVRRHERRRRKAEEQLTEAESNLSRVEDILAELRPQARRLAAQAEQQASRVGAGEELAAGLLLAAHVRWHEAAARVVAATARLEATREESAAALAALQAEEEAAGAIAASLGERANREVERREAHEAARVALTSLQMRSTRLGSELEAIGRDRERATVERAAADASLAQRRRELSEPPPARDLALEERAAAAERALAESLAELTSLRAADRERGDEIAALRRAEAARQAELDGARRRIGEVARRLGEERAKRDTVVGRRTELEGRQATAHATLEAAVARESGAAAAREAARTALETLEGRRREADDAAGSAGSKLASLRGRLEALVARVAEEEARGIAKAAKKRGGRRVDEALQVDPALRAAVEAGLGEAARAYLVGADAVAELASERGLLVVERDGAPGGGAAAKSAGAPATLRDRVAAAGGGFLVDAIRADGTGAAKLLLSSVAWVPTLEDLLALQPALPDGWLAVARDGSAVASRHTIALGKADAALERRAEVERLSGQVEAAAAEAERATAGAAALADELRTARTAFEAARSEEGTAAAARRRAEEEERSAARSLEQVAREAAWLDAQVARLDAESAEAATTLGTLEAAATAAASASAAAVTEGADAETAAAIAAWEARVGELRATRDRVAAELGEAERIRREIEAVRARAEASAAMDEERIARADRELASLAERERALGEEREGIARETAGATVREEAARAALGELRAADAADRERLAAAEAAAARARDRLRTADERHRAAEVADLEARLGLDAIREQLLVELAGLGELALRTLGVARADGAEDDGSALEAALAAKAEEWASVRPAGEPPSPARLASLRRRYHDLGAGNPFAVDEYEELKERLVTLETQERDLRDAIAKTRELIEELDRLISIQFRETFAQLETAFDVRFQQLFGGGFAKLSLTDPADLGTTGIEIVARPPGKKAQSLSMLSGGERALTAVALLFAMLEVRPVPFCVLDEVDAALDEANVGRFGDALRGLSERTQFIVITHNRGTIEAADALYGVTVGDDSVSRVISLRLEEAKALAADRARTTTLIEG